MKLILCGAAPLTADLGIYLKAVLGIPILEGYGLTETCGCGFMQLPEDYHSGNCGGPIPNVEVKLIDVPEMKYSANDKDVNENWVPRGEILIRGGVIFKRYYKNPEKTKEDLDSEGWFHTGDIAQMNKNGSFTIIDRKKNIFKLAQGEYIAPEKIEAIMKESNFVEDVFVFGKSDENNLVGILVPNKHVIDEIQTATGIHKNLEDLIEDEKVIDFLLNQVNSLGKAKGLNGFELLKKVTLSLHTFRSQELYTPSMKLKRNEVQQIYKNDLEMLYNPSAQ